jgi:hypothetical protein
VLGKGKQLVERAGGLVKDEAFGLIRDAKQTKGPLKERALGLVKGRPLRLLKGAGREAAVTPQEEGETTKDHSEYFRNLIRETNRRSTGEAERSTEVAESQDQAGDDLPLEDYDSMNVHQISERLDDLSTEEVRRLRDYEARKKNRRTLIGRFDRRIEAGSS